MFEQTFRNIDDVLRKEAGCATEMDYTEQTSWLLFLKYLDDLEHERSLEAELLGNPYAFLLKEAFRWSSWSAPKTAEGELDSCGLAPRRRNMNSPICMKPKSKIWVMRGAMVESTIHRVRSFAP